MKTKHLAGARRPRARALALSAALLLSLAATGFAQESDAALEFPGRLVPIKFGDTRPLPVCGLSLRVDLQPLVARVEVDQVFYNPHSSTIETGYFLNLPKDALVTRLTMNVNERPSMDVPEKMMEGELATVPRAREAYTTIVRQKRDPALTEWLGGGRFSTRIFPVFRQSFKRVLIEYSMVLEPGASSLLVPSPYGKNPEKLQWFELSVEKSPRMTGSISAAFVKDGALSPVELVNGKYSAHDASMAGGVKIEWTPFHPAPELIDVQELDAAGGRFALAVLPATAPNPADASSPRDFIILADTSLSGGEDRLSLTASAVKNLIKSMKSGDRFILACFDLTADLFRYGSSLATDAGIAEEAAQWIGMRGTGGATHLGRAIEAGVKAAKHFGGWKPVEMILLSDGKNTMDGNPELAGKLAALRRNPDIRLHCLGFGDDRDEKTLIRLANEGRGVYMNLSAPPEGGFLEAIRSSPRGFRMSPEPASGFDPGGGGGSARILLLDFGPGGPPDSLILESGPAGKASTLRLEKRTADRHEAFAAALLRITMLHAGSRLSGAAPELLARTSLRFGIICSETSYIVLETAKDYEAWDIERLQAARRKGPPPVPRSRPGLIEAGPPQKPRPADPPEEAPVPGRQPVPKSIADAESDLLLNAAASDPGVIAARQRALSWLARHQNADGSWSCRDFEKKCGGERCSGPGSTSDYDVGVTGLALLAFLFAGDPLESGKETNVRKGVDYLLSAMTPDGCIGRKDAGGHWTYNHAICTQALARAARVIDEGRIRDAMQKAADFLVHCQNPYLGWRYGIQPGDSDTSVTGWAAEALLEARESGVEVPEEVFIGAGRWLDKVTDETYFKTGYTSKGDCGSRLSEAAPARMAQEGGVRERRPLRDRGERNAGPGPRRSSGDTGARLADAVGRFQPNEAMTAVAVNLRLRAGDPEDVVAIAGGLKLLAAFPPKWSDREGTIDFYYWFWGANASARACISWRSMRSVTPGPWRSRECFLAWWPALLEALLQNQRRDGCAAGSWDPVDAWGAAGGRVYSTALCCLALSVPLMLLTSESELGRLTDFDELLNSAGEARDPAATREALKAVKRMIDASSLSEEAIPELLNKALPLARDLIGSGDPDSALEALLACMKAAPSDVRPAVLAAWAMLKKNEIDESLRRIEAAIGMDASVAKRTDVSAFYHAAAKAALEKGDAGALSAAVNRWLELAGHDSRLDSLLDNAAESGNADLLASLIEAALKHAIDRGARPSRLKSLSLCLSALGRDDEAHRVLFAFGGTYEFKLEEKLSRGAFHWVENRDWNRGAAVLKLIPSSQRQRSDYIRRCIEAFGHDSQALQEYSRYLLSLNEEIPWKRDLRIEFAFELGFEAELEKRIFDEIGAMAPKERDDLAANLLMRALGQGRAVQAKALLSQPFAKALASREDVVSVLGWTGPGARLLPAKWLEEAVSNFPDFPMLRALLFDSLVAEGSWNRAVRSYRDVAPPERPPELEKAWWRALLNLKKKYEMRRLASEYFEEEDAGRLATPEDLEWLIAMHR